MIARGFILLGFKPSGMRTGHGSLEEEHTLLAFGRVRVRMITGQVMRTISSSTSCPRTLVHYMEKGERNHTFIFCTVVMIVCVLQKEINFAVWLSPGDDAGIACFLYIITHFIGQRINCRSLILTVFHATGWSCRPI